MKELIFNELSISMKAADQAEACSVVSRFFKHIRRLHRMDSRGLDMNSRLTILNLPPVFAQRLLSNATIPHLW